MTSLKGMPHSGWLDCLNADKRKFVNRQRYKNVLVGNLGDTGA